MNQESESNNVSQFDGEEQQNTRCPYKPNIPYNAAKKSFVPKTDNASYLDWKEMEKKQQALVKIGTSYNSLKKHECCDKFSKITEGNRKSLENQIRVMSQLSIMIADHSKLLKQMIQSKQDESDKNKLSGDVQDNSRELSEKERLFKQWKEKWENEHKLNGQRDVKIKELQRKIQELEESTSQSTVSTALQDEVNTWKNKFISLNKTYNETQQKLTVLEGELEMLKSQPSSLRQSGVQSTTTTTTRRRTTVKGDEIQ